MNYFTIILFCVLSTICALGDNLAEAKRFFDEYEVRLTEATQSPHSRGKEWDNVKTPLEVAVTLVPDNPHYWRELIILEVTRVRDKRVNLREKIDIFRNFLQEVETFYEKYPDYRHPRERIFTSWSHGKNPINAFNEFSVKGASDFERTELAEVFTELRKLRDRERKKQKSYRELDLSNGINSVRELQVYEVWLRFKFDYNWYYDTAAMVRDNYQQVLEFYRAMRDFVVKNPEVSRHNLRICKLFPHFYFDHWHYAETVAEFKKIFTDFDEITSLVKEIDYEPLTVEYYSWLAIGEFIQSDHSIKTLKKAIFGFYDNLEKYTSRKDATLSNFYYISAAFVPKDERHGLGYGLRDVRGEYELMKANKDTFESYLARLKRGGGEEDIERLKRFVPELRSSALTAICDNDTRIAFGRVDNYLRKNKSSPEHRKILDDLNATWNIQEIPFGKRGRLVAAESNGKYFMLFRNYSSNLLQFLEFDVEKMSFDELQVPEPEMHKFQEHLFSREYPISMSASEGHLIFGGRDSVLLYNIATQKWTFVEDLPGFYVVSGIISRGRCYVLLGKSSRDTSEKAMLSMSSFALDGSKRKLHFSNRRVDKLNPLDALPRGSFSDLIAMPDGKILFSISFFVTPAFLYCFDPTTENFEKIREFKDTCSLVLRDQGNFILGSYHALGERFFKLDKATLKLEYLLSQSRRDSRWAKENQVKHIKGWSELRAPFLLADGFLISARRGYGCPLVLNLENPENSPLLMVPVGVNFFRLKAKTYLFIGQNQLSIAELK